MVDTKRLLDEVEDYDSFYTLEELDKRAQNLSIQYNYELKKIGTSLENRPMYLLKVGNGKKKAFVWGFPHPNEPIGSLAIDFLLNYFGRNPEFLEKLGYTWYFMYTADPDGTKLNEGWFKKKLTIQSYFSDFYRPPANRMIDWTFPIQYKECEWDKPMPETEILMKIMDEIKPDLMYPLHNSGFGGAYFFSTKAFDNEYYDTITHYTKKLSIPLHMGEPEDEFMIPIKKPFYFDFGFKDYYEHEIKMRRRPEEILQHGDNSTHYLLRSNPHAIVIKGEVPYFYDKKTLDLSMSHVTKRDAWLSIIEQSDKNIAFYKKIIPKILDVLKEPDPHWYLIKDLERQCMRGNENFKKHVMNSSEFDKKATQSELFDFRVTHKFYTGLGFGQIRRAAKKAKLDSEIITKIEDKMKTYASFVEKNSDWKAFPIKKLVQLQLLVLFETMRAINRENDS